MMCARVSLERGSSNHGGVVGRQREASADVGFICVDIHTMSIPVREEWPRARGLSAVYAPVVTHILNWALYMAADAAGRTMRSDDGCPLVSLPPGMEARVAPVWSQDSPPLLPPLTHWSHHATLTGDKPANNN